MAKKSDRKALGRGLSALLGENQAIAQTVSTAPGTQTELAGPRVPIDLIHANPEQPRQAFRDSDLRDLAASIQTHGVIQPVLLRPHPEKPGEYQIVAGERRWRAAQLANVHDLPAIVRDLDEKDLLELAIIENIQRVDLDPIEEAQAYTQLIDAFGYTQEELSNVIGKSRSHLANTLRLLSLPEQIQAMVRAGKLSAGHGRALIGAADPIKLAEETVNKGLTVRQVEELARKVPKSTARKANAQVPEKDADTRMLEGDLSAAIGMRVRIQHTTADGGGEVAIRYKSLDDLDRLCRKLSE